MRKDVRRLQPVGPYPGPSVRSYRCAICSTSTLKRHPGTDPVSGKRIICCARCSDDLARQEAEADAADGWCLTCPACGAQATALTTLPGSIDPVCPACIDKAILSA